MILSWDGHANATTASYGAYSTNDTTRYLYLGIPRNTYTGENDYIRIPESTVAQVLGVTGAKIAQGQSIAGVSGTYTSDATATASQILSGAIAYVKGSKITGTIKSKGATTYTPGTSNQTISAGQYLSGAQTIKGDGNLTAGNIKSGVSIFGVSGTFTSDATATSGDIAEGKTAYVKGQKVTGTGGNYKVYKMGTYSISGYLTNPGLKVTSITSEYCGIPKLQEGSWKAITSKNSDSTACYVYFNVDLGFVPTEVVSCNIILSGKTVGSNIDTFRFSRGYGSGSTSQTYYYTDNLIATLESMSYKTAAGSPNSYGIWGTQCKIKGNKLMFGINLYWYGSSGGVPIYTNTTEHYISGSIVYK